MRESREALRKILENLPIAKYRLSDGRTICMRCNAEVVVSALSAHKAVTFTLEGYIVTCEGNNVTTRYDPALAIETSPCLRGMGDAMAAICRDLRIIKFDEVFRAF